MPASIDHTVCIAPMMAWTDRHFRAFMRCISQRMTLYTEMVTAPAVLHGNRDKLLGFNEPEHPIALQLGGSDPNQLKECAKIAESYGYDEINLNVGCPSDRVQSGRFGACLMKEPELVADCMAAMAEAVSIPVTVKCRLGVDEYDSYDYLYDFIEKIQKSDVKTFIVHARKAWLKGLNPKQNREIPPLKYDRVYRLKNDFPELEIIINGGIRSLEAMEAHLQHVDGVMIGRAAYEAPECLQTVDQTFYGIKAPVRQQRDWVLDYIPYIISQLAKGVPLRHMTKHLVGLFTGQPGARLWRRYLSENAYKEIADENIVLKALNYLASGR